MRLVLLLLLFVAAARAVSRYGDYSIAATVVAMVTDPHSAVDQKWQDLLTAPRPFAGSVIAQSMLMQWMDRRLAKHEGDDPCVVYGRAVLETFRLMKSTGIPYAAPPMDRRGDAAAALCRAWGPPPWTRAARKTLWLATTRTVLLPSDPEA